MLRLGSSEWQATQARYMRSPRVAAPGSAVARHAVARVVRSQGAGFGSSSTSIDFSVVTRFRKRRHACRLRPNAFRTSFVCTRDVTSSGRCQIRGGRNGGLPGSEANGLAANGIARLAKVEGNMMVDEDVPAKLKHFSAQVAMAAQ